MCGNISKNGKHGDEKVNPTSTFRFEDGSFEK